MECTQRLECTQELYTSQTDAVCPEQIGFLGICGTKYPVKRGPNKIGRDSSVCSIVLNLDSISRNHAVINIMNQTEFMLMDLDSANKTRLNNKVLQPYIPYPLNNCDTVQFGTVFGVFRLLQNHEEDHNLPSTQAIEVPDTPDHFKHVSRFKGAGTTIPESPEVSDRDDSFIMPSQPKEKQLFKSPNTAKYIKQSSKTTAINPIGSNQIDNVYWSSSKKSLSIDDSGNISDDDSLVTANNTCQNDDIHEVDTQPPFMNKLDDPNNSIYTADTQMPNVSKDAIHTADTQFPDNAKESIFTASTQMPVKDSVPSIHTLDTQIPEHLPSVQRISDQRDMQLDIFTENKENVSVHNAKTQLFDLKYTPATSEDVVDEDDDIFNAATQFPFDKQNSPDDFEKDVSIFEANTQFSPPNNDSDSMDIKQQKDSSVKDKSELCNELSKNVIIVKSEVTSDKDEKDNNKSQKENVGKVTSDKVEESDNHCEDKSASTTKNKLNNTSDEEILFGGIDSQSFEDPFDSQPLIPSEDLELLDVDPDLPLSQSKIAKSKNETDILCEKKENLKQEPIENKEIKLLSTQKKSTIVTEKVTTEKDTEKQTRKCDEKPNLIQNTLGNDDISILHTQKLSILNPMDEDDSTDCESDNESKMNKSSSLHAGMRKVDSSDMSFEDLATNVLEEKKCDNRKQVEEITNKIPNDKLDNNVPVEDMATQVLVVTEIVSETDDIPFADMATQVLEEEDIFKEIEIKSSRSQKDQDDVVFVDNDIGELPTQILPKSDDLGFEEPSNILEDVPEKPNINTVEQYSEELISPFKVPCLAPLKRNSSFKKPEHKIVVSPIVSTVKKPPSMSPKKEPPPVDITDVDEKHYDCTQDILDDLSSQQLESPKKLQDNTSNIDSQVATLKRAGSDSTDPELTPKKVRPMRLIHIELPDSQEIKTSVSFASRLNDNQSSSESEPEQNSEEMTPIVFRKKKKKANVDAKIDLIKKFEASSAQPKRIISRVRKPTAKLQESNVLKGKSPINQYDVDTEIITENITRLKSKTEKKCKAAEVSKVIESKAFTESKEYLKVKVKEESSNTKFSVKIENSPNQVSRQKETKKNDVKAEKLNETNNEEKRIRVKKEELKKKTEKDDKKKSIAKKTTGKDETEIDDKNKSLDNKKSSRNKKYKSKLIDDLKDKRMESENETSEVETSIKSMKYNDSLETSDVVTSRKTRSCRRNQSNDSSKSRSATPVLVLTEQKPSDSKGRRKIANNSKISEKDDTIDLTKAATATRKRKSKQNNAKKDDSKAKIITTTEQNTVKKAKKPAKETESKTKGKQKTTQKDELNKNDSEKNVRRSRRQKTDSQKDTIDKYLVDTQKSVQNNSKSVHEISTVYSVSSDASISSYNTSSSLKRRAPNHIEIEAPNPKRTRSLSRGNISLRATPARMLRTQHVLFTAFNNNDVKNILEKLGAVIVTDVKACTMVLTGSIKRTFKLLCAVGLGVPIVGPTWVQACLDTNMVVDPWQYILKDEECESRFQFSLQRTLASKRGFLKGYNVSSTPKVLPDTPEMKLIVECSGGTWKASGPNWICVSCPSDKPLWPDLLAKGASIVSTEFILSGVLKQIAEVKKFGLRKKC